MDKANGSSSKIGSSNGASHSQMKPGLAPNKTTIPRKMPGGIQVSTVKRVAPPPRPSSASSTSSTSTSNAHRFNGLSEEKRQRVEEIRREREKKKREEEEKLRPPKASSSKPRDTTASKRKKAAKHESEDDDDDDDDDDLFSTGSETSKKKKKKPVFQRSQVSSQGEGYKKLGRFGVLPYYMVPRRLVDEEAFATVTGEKVKARQSASLVHGKQYGQCEWCDGSTVALMFVANHAED